MPNPFDQFDEPGTTATATANPFDQFDTAPQADPRAARRAELQAQQAAARSAGETTSFSARAAAGIEQGLRTPEAMVRGGLDALQYYRALDAVTGSGDRFQRQNEAELRAMRDRDAFLARETQAIEGRDGRNFVGDLVQGVARGVVELPPQLMAGAAGAMRGAAVQASAAMGGLQGGLSQFAQERGEGRSQLEALPPAVASGLITAVTTRAFGDSGVEAVFRNEGVQGFRRRLVSVLREAGMEGAEEFTDQVQQDLLERATRNPGKRLEDSLYDTMQALGVGAAIGGFANTPRLLQRPDGRTVLVNEQTGGTEFGPLEVDELPAPIEDSGERIEDRPASPLSSILYPLPSTLSIEPLEGQPYDLTPPETVPPEASPAPTAAPAPAGVPRELPEVPGVPTPLEGQPYEVEPAFEQTMFRGDTRETPLTPEKAEGGIHFSSDESYAETFTQVGMAQNSGVPIVAARVKLANPLDLRRFATGYPFTIAELKRSLSEQGVPLSLKLSLRTPGMKEDGVETLGQLISAWGPDSERIDEFSPNESLTDYIGGAIKKLGKHDGILFQEHGLDITSAVVFSSKSLNQNATGGPKAASAGIKTPLGSPETSNVQRPTSNQPQNVISAQALRTNPPQVAQPIVIESTATVQLKDGTVLKGQGWAIPGIESLKVVLIPPRGSKTKATAMGWSVFVDGKLVYSNLKGGEMDTPQQALSVAIPRLRRLAASTAPTPPPSAQADLGAGAASPRPPAGPETTAPAAGKPAKADFVDVATALKRAYPFQGIKTGSDERAFLQKAKRLLGPLGVPKDVFDRAVESERRPGAVMVWASDNSILRGLLKQGWIEEPSAKQPGPETTAPAVGKLSELQKTREELEAKRKREDSKPRKNGLRSRVAMELQKRIDDLDRQIAPLKQAETARVEDEVARQLAAEEAALAKRLATPLTAEERQELEALRFSLEYLGNLPVERGARLRELEERERHGAAAPRPPAGPETTAPAAGSWRELVEKSDLSSLQKTQMLRDVEGLSSKGVSEGDFLAAIWKAPKGRPLNEGHRRWNRMASEVADLLYKKSEAKPAEVRPAEPGEQPSPMMQQYQRIKAQLPPDTLLAFRLGDFYEFFFDGAGVASRALGVALTNRRGVPMAGIPYHAARSYFEQLVAKGHKVAVVDQVGEAKPGEPISRQVTAVIGESKRQPKSNVKPAEVRPADPGEQPKPPAQAAPAMQEGMDNLRFTSDPVKTAKAGGADAKDAKAKLIAELEKAVEAAKPADYYGIPEKGRTGEPDLYWVDVKMKEKGVPASQHKVTVEIPGDGTFTVWNVKEVLEQLLSRAKRLETSTKPPKGYSESGVSKEDREWADQMRAAQGKPVVDWWVPVNTRDAKGVIKTVSARTAFEAEQEAAQLPDAVAVQKGAARRAPDRIEAALDAAEAKLTGTPGEVMEGVTGAPVWVTKAAARGVIQVVRAVYRASKDLAAALRAGLEWLRAQNLPGFSESQAAGWLNATITLGNGPDGLNLRATPDLLDASDLLPQEAKDLIANRAYTVVTDAQAVDFAHRILDALGNPELAFPILADATNGLGGKARTVLAFVTLTRLTDAITKARAAGDTATAERLEETEAMIYDSTLADRITDAAQTVQAVSAFSKMSKGGRIVHARRRIQRAQAHELGPLKPDLEEARKKLKQAGPANADETAKAPDVQGAARQAVNQSLEAEAQQPGSALQQAIALEASNTLELLPSVLRRARAAVLATWHKLGLGEQVREQTTRAGQGLENSLWAAVQRRGGAQSTVSSVIAQVNRALHEQVNRALGVTKEQFVNPTTYLMRLRDALGNAELMSRIWEQTRAAVGANLRAIGEMERLLVRIEAEIAELEAQAKQPLDGGPEVTATDPKLKAAQQGARDAMLAGRNANITEAIKQRRERSADVTAQLAEYRKLQPAWEAVLGMTVDVWGPNLLRGVLREQMKADGFRLNKAVADHFRGLSGAVDPLATLGTLRDKIVAASGLDPQAAERLAKAIEAEYTALVEKERAKVKERIEAARQRAKERAAKRAAEQPKTDAEALIDGYERLQTEWLKPPGRKSVVRAIVRQALRQGAAVAGLNESVVRGGLQDQLEAVGVPTEAAYRLAYEVWQARQAAGGGVDAVLAARMKALQVNLGKLVREHWSKQERAGESLAEQLAGEGGLSPEGADRLAAAFTRRFKQLAEARTRRELANILKPVTQSPKAKVGLVEKLMGLLHLGALTDKAYWDAVRERLKLPEFSEALRDRLTAIGARLDALPEGDIEGRHRLSVEFLNELERAAGLDTLDVSLGFYITNLLMGVPTHIANLGANFSNALAEAGIEMTRALAERRWSDIPAAVEAAGAALKPARAQAGQVWRTGILPAQRQGNPAVSRALDLARFGERGGVPLRATGYVSKAAKAALESYPAKILNLWKFNGRAMAAEDLIFFTPALEVKRQLIARRIASTEGARGAALDAKVAEVLARGEPTLEEDARQYGLRMVKSQMPYGLLGEVVNLINLAKGSNHPALRGAANIVAPVLTVPMNSFNDSLNYTPLGFWRMRSGASNLLGREVATLTPEQQRDLRAELFAKAITGSLLLTATALMLAQFLDDDDPLLALYGTGPSDPTDNKGWRERGGLPHSFKVGDTYWSYALTPISGPLAALGNWMDKERDVRKYGRRGSDDLATQAGAALLATMDVLFEQPFMVGFVDLFSLATGHGSDETKLKSGFRRAAKTAASFVIPNEVRNVDRYFDPKVYPVRDLETALLTSVPFVRGVGGQPALNALGQPIESHPFHRFISRQASDPLVQILDSKGAWPTMPTDRNHIWPSRRRPMTEAEFYQYQRSAGAGLANALRREEVNLSRLPAEAARKRVQDLAEREREIARRRLGF